MRSAPRQTLPLAAESVHKATIQAIPPHLSPQVAAMVELEHLTGARLQEVVATRPARLA